MVQKVESSQMLITVFLFSVCSQGQTVDFDTVGFGCIVQSNPAALKGSRVRL